VQALGQPADEAFVILPLQLTIAGWDRADAIRRGGSISRAAFMAMPFGKPELDAIYRDHFQKAVKDTGFTIKRLDENQPAGLIDDRMRVEIRQCRFLISDLTHGNPGAYWEAGYAEGLGKPVIYTCELSVFADRAKGTHFDTNHHLTVVWDSASPAVAAAKLKATIRATLPNEALLSDE
jgi:nucleoside 2-deoxyribosyltransferase